MTITTRTILIAGTVAFAWLGRTGATEPPLQPVEKAVNARTGVAVRWQQNAAARDEALAGIRSILKKPLTVNGAVQIALLNNRELLATLEDVGVSAADLRQAGIWKNPAIDLSIRFPDRASAVADNEESAAVDILDLLMLPLRKRVAADHLAATQLRVSDEALRLVGEVKETVYSLQADEAMLAQRKAVVEINAAALELARRQQQAGNITDLALAQQEAAGNSARLEALMTENEQREHREKLNRLLSLWGGDVGWKLAGGLPPLAESDGSVERLESLAVAQRLDLAAARFELTSLVRALGLTKSYRYIGALEFGVDSEREPERTRITGPTLRLELPLFNQGQARIAKGEAELRRAERKCEGLAIDIRTKVRALREQLDARREIVSFYRDQILPARRAITIGTLLRYNGMLVGNYDLFAAREAEIEAEEKSVEALRDYWTTRAQLERAVGGNLPMRPAAQTVNK